MRSVVALIILLLLLSGNATAGTESPASTPKDVLRVKKSGSEELRLLYITFVYAGDLKNAIEVAKIALLRYPDSIYWNEKMAEVLQWSGRSEEAMEYMKKLYALTHKESIAKKIVAYDLSVYHYEEALRFVKSRYKHTKDPKDLELLLFLYQKVAEPDKAADLLFERYKSTKQKNYLIQALRIALQMGDMQRAQKYAKILQKLHPYTYEQSLLLANYFYVRRDLHQAYETILQAKPSSKSQSTHYLKEHLYTKSDLGWFFQDIDNAVDASMRSIEMHAGRQVDYERAIYYYKDKDARMTMMLSREAYERFELGYLFFTYADTALKEHRYKELAAYMERVERKDAKLASEPMFWFVRYRLLSALGQKERALAVVAQLLDAQNTPTTLQTTLLWSLMDHKDVKLLKEVLVKLRERDVSPALYFPMASAYLYLGDVDAANYFADMLVRSNMPAANSVEFLFLQAYIYQAQAREGLFMTTMRRIVTKMQERMRQNPALAHDPTFMAIYLRAVMYIEPAEYFEKRLQQVKSILKPKAYREITYSFAAKRGARSRAHLEAMQNRGRTLWIAFSDALSHYESAKLQKMLHHYFDLLAKGDAIKAADLSGQRALAQSIAYWYMQHNRHNEQAQLRYIELVKKRSDMLQAKTAWYRRENLQANYLQLKNENYIAEGWSLQEGLRLAPGLSSLSDAELYNLPSSLFYGYAGVAKMLDRGKVTLLATYHNKLAGYMGFEASLLYDLRRDLSLKLDVALNKDALETTSLLVGGKKDSASVQVVFSPLSSSSLELYGEFNRYKSDDDVALGSGLYYRAALMHTYHSAYPDIEFGVVVEGGSYSQKSGPHGIIDTIQPQDFAVLPQNYLSVGPMFSCGMQKRHLYTREWRPYCQGGVFYNSENSDFNYALEAGMGGRVFRQDHLSVGASYSEFVRGVNDKVLEFYLDYEFYY